VIAAGSRRDQEGETGMTNTSRRSLLRGSLAIAAAGSLARPFIANAAATTATVWWSQGFAQEEDVAFRKIVAAYEKASGNTIDYSIIPFAPLRQKIISAITSGGVPDLIDANPIEFVALQAWDGKLEDVSDVVATQQSRIMPTALLGARCYNSVEKKRSFYGVPYKGSVRPFHYWRDLVVKAGYKESDIPNTWDAFIDFFKPVQQKLRDQGLRHTYATGFVLSTVGFDVASTFDQFLIAHGGGGLVTKDGKLHADDPQVKAAAVKSLAYLGALYRGGYVPPGTVSWNDADDNNAYHSKQCVMDLDGTLSTEVAMIHDKQAYYHDMVVRGLPRSNEGQPIASVFAANLAFVPKGAKNVAVGKEFAAYLIQPKVNADYLKVGLGRFLPVMPELVTSDPWWTDPKQDPHRPPYVRQAMVDPTVPYFWVFNPAYAEVETEHVWGLALADVMVGGMEPQPAADKALKRIEAIFAKYPIEQS
jgi:multiple sugar transport system substrate-binding protein